MDKVNHLSGKVKSPFVHISFPGTAHFELSTLGKFTPLVQISPPIQLIFGKNNNVVGIFQLFDNWYGYCSTFGNRKKVLIVREENNVVTKKYVDLTNDAILGSPWYTLRPNDIVYVEPLSRRIFGIETLPWSLITSAVSTTIVIMTFMITLLN